MDLLEVVYVVCALVAGIATLLKLRDLVRGMTRPSRGSVNGQLLAVCATLTGITGTFVFANPAVYLGVDSLTGMPNLAAPIVFACTIVFAGSAQVMLLSYQYPTTLARPKIRLRITAVVAVLAVMFTLFALASTPRERPLDFEVYYATTPLIAVYFTVYLTAYSVGVLGILRMSIRWSRFPTSRWLRHGLRLLVIGSCWALAYTAFKVVALTGRWSGTTMFDHIGNPLAPLSGNMAGLCFSIGFTLPAIGPWLSNHLLNRRLHPLWHGLTEANLNVRMSQTGIDIEERLLRKVIEIRDSQLALAGYITPEVLGRARVQGVGQGLDGDELRAFVTATGLRHALASKAQGQPAHESAALHAEPGGEDLASEVAWLAKVSRAFRTARR